MTEVSIIVPVYNGAQYIRQCISFLKAQRFDDYEIIFSVDSKSSDGSADIVKDEGDRDPRIRLVLQTDDDQLAGARNNGLLNASGRYVWFCDVDDAPSPEFVPVMHGLVADNDADFASCAFVNEGPEGTVRDKGTGTVRILDRDDAVRLLSRGGITVSTWSKMFDRRFLIDNGLFFRRSRAEDIEYLYRALFAAERIAVTDRILYAYRQTQDSLCRTPGGGTPRGLGEIEAYRRADEIWADHPDRDEILRHNALMRMRSSGHMDREDFLGYRYSPEAIEDYRRYFKHTLEGGLYYHFPKLYHSAINFYIRHVYKRNGSRGMKKLKRRTGRTGGDKRHGGISMQSRHKAVLLDRDDTICPDVPHNGDPAKMHVFPYSPEAVRKLNDAGYLVIVVTNQSGIGRGLYTADDMAAVHEEMKSQLSVSGAHIDDIYYCPHRPDEGCGCRKPAPALGFKAIQDHDLDPEQCWMVGDKDTDVGFGRALGMRTLKVSPGFTLLDAVDRILSQRRTPRPRAGRLSNHY